LRFIVRIGATNGENLVDNSDIAMKDQNYSWKGSPNAGKILAGLALIAGILLVIAGFGS